MKKDETTVLDDGREKRLQGAPVSEGIAIGKLFFVNSIDEEELPPEFAISGGQVDAEIKRYRRALSSSHADLKKLQEELSKEGESEVNAIIDSHIGMLEDPLLNAHMEEMIRKMKRNSEAVFKNVVDGYKKKLAASKDTLFQERIVDVLDLSNRILSHLQTKPKTSFADIPHGSIVFAKELAPSDTASAQASRVSAFVTQVGGGSSHTALIARAKGIPFVSSIDVMLLKQAHGQHVIVNGLTGDVIINPNTKTIEKYTELQKVLKEEARQLEAELSLKAETVDGVQVFLFANVGCGEEIGEIHGYGACGVGLFRTEFLLSDDPDIFLSEEKQFQVYKEAALLVKGAPLVLRTFDIGGDKFPELVLERENNLATLTGCRGIRFMLRHVDIFATQLTALLRAAHFGSLRLLLPHISNLDELRQTKMLIESVKKDLSERGEAFGDLALGCLIEVPAAVLIAEELAQECDFFSIGTNDLIQYLLGIEREGLEMSDYYYPAHPSVLKTIKTIVESAAKYKKPVTLCGEIAANPHFIPLLLGLGLRSFSCASRYIPIIKHIIRKCHSAEAEQLAREVLHLSTPEETAHRLRTHYQNLTRR